MSYLFSSVKVRRFATLCAVIFTCIALVASAADDGMVVDIGSSTGNGVNVTAGSGVGGLFTGLYGLQVYGTTYGGLFQHSEGLVSVSLAQEFIGVATIGVTKGIFAESSGGVGGEFTGMHGVQAYGWAYGGLFQDSNGTGSVTLAQHNVGVITTGLDKGIYAEASGSSSIGGDFHGDFGVKAYGLSYGGYFEDTNGTGRATLAQHHVGVTATGMDKGIYAEASGSSSIGGEFHGDYGVQAYGLSYGGYFKDTNGTSAVRLAQDDVGINALAASTGIYAEASSPSTGTGGEFHGANGVKAYGVNYGGFFQDSNGNASVYLAQDDVGVNALGLGTGIYAEASSPSTGTGGEFHGAHGVKVYGSTYAGLFEDSDSHIQVKLAENDVGVTISETPSEGTLFMGVSAVATGVSSIGGWFGGADLGLYGFSGVGGVSGAGPSWGVKARRTPSGPTVFLPDLAATLIGNGPVATIQNHPYSKDLVVVSHAPVGDEFATYTRGSARLEGGEAVIPLGEVFRVTTNPDYGLTAHITPVGGWADLYVAEKTTEHIVVRGVGSTTDAAFDYQVWGLRIGFEEAPIVRVKTEDAGLPSMAPVRLMNERRPDLRAHAAAGRFVDIEAKARRIEAAELDMSRSRALIEAIGVTKPEIQQLRRPGSEQADRAPILLDEQGDETREDVAHGSSAADILGGTREGGVTFGGSPDVRARSFQPSLSELARHHSVRGEADPGDVLVASADGSGVFLRSNVEVDAAVVGVVASAPGLVLGGGAENAADGEEYQVPVALAGIADVKVDADYGPIAVGDLLVTSPTPGHAMRDSAALPGTVLGKALQPLDSGRGTIQVLIMLR